ncbi:nucleotidyl transferase AbiEii/AbiGii toxin family protein [Nitriliruptor alkaliphilus]|uniref:nucleotidyl transferase AbiEii/AbiGii toxin family protein n=1 Tax=Nitriliruptor alkaliphilus TaxID=427918 RepID=UPI00069898C2|nr:nucleotidyl transferase AbiEii/AbiGii toxin family protein [Nitriliruptor alkaliphilus]
MQLDDVLAVLEALEAQGVDYAVIGAMALAAHGLDRATRDLDLFVAPDEENVARLRRALHSVFEDPSIDEITSVDLAGEYPVMQYGPPDVDYSIDLVSRLGDTFAFADLEVMEVDVRGRTMRVVTPATLYRMKRDTVRGRDRDDAERLRDAFDLEA